MATTPKDKDTKKPAKKTAAAPKKAASAASDKAVKTKSASPKAKREGAPVQRRPLMEKTYFAKPGELAPKWRLVDAEGQTLGRLSTYIATALMGKDKPTYTRSADSGDFIVVINAEKIQLTGSKWQTKEYFHHTGFPGGIKSQTAEFIRETHPERLVEKAVWRMLPHGHMGRHWFSKLKVYAGPAHPHGAQQPQPVKLAQ